MNRNSLALCVTAALLLQACSSRPRAFTPSLAAPPASQAEFDAAYASCTELLVAGKLDSSGRLASAGGGAAAAGATAAAGAAAASSAGFYGGLAVASATVIALPFVALAGAWGMSKMKRTKKEKAIKAAMEGCLAERGYRVQSWSKTSRTAKVVAAADASAPVTAPER